jgi:hypothetical protein
MNIVRWILFPVVGFFLPGIAQLITGVISLHYTWGIALLLTFFLGIFLACAGALPVHIAPNRKIGAGLFIVSIIAFTCWELATSSPHVQPVGWLIYVYTKAAIVLGAVIAVGDGKRSRQLFLSSLLKTSYHTNGTSVFVLA